MATRKDPHPAAAPRGTGDPLVHRSVADAEGLDAVFEGSLPSFGGAFLRRTWKLLDEAIGLGLPMTLSISGPVTASGQHYAWLNPLLDTGWFGWISVTDAICYHDGHRALESVQEADFREVPIFGDDGQLRDDEVIRITDIGFPEGVLLDTDLFLQALLRLPEFQRRMTGPEFRHLLGARFADAERLADAREGLLALCHRKAIPIFVGAPADGSVFLNSTLMWAEQRVGGAPHSFELDLHGEVYESCAYHRWGLFESQARDLGALVLGGGVPKNFNLQPEPALGQVFGLEGIRGYLYDIQITTAPVTDGSLSSCPPAEAVTWGKVDRDSYRKTTESLSCDYSIVMPFLVKALLDKQKALSLAFEELGEKGFHARYPGMDGYLRPTEGYRLYDRREDLLARLDDHLREARITGKVQE